MEKITTNKIEIALYSPEIAQNVGTIIRTCAAMSIKMHVIHPCGFVWDSKLLARAAMDYIELANVIHHNTWSDFQRYITENTKRTIGAICNTNTQAKPFHQFVYSNNDIIVFGQESSGLPTNVENSLADHITIPMQAEARSLNLAISVGIILSKILFSSDIKKC